MRRALPVIEGGNDCITCRIRERVSNEKSQQVIRLFERKENVNYDCTISTFTISRPLSCLLSWLSCMNDFKFSPKE